MMFEIPLTDMEINEIQKIIETKDQCKIDIQKTFNTIWFRGDNDETELRLNFLGNMKLIVSRVCFHNKRQGTMEAILHLLEEYCKKYHIKKICIQSVVTKEMDNFCKKWNLLPDPNASFMFDDFVGGDHIKEIDLDR